MQLISGSWAYPAIAASIAGSALVPALPSESMLAAAMGLAAAGRLHLGWVCLAAATGSMLGDLAAYALGRSVRAVPRRRLGRYRASAASQWLQAREQHWGPGIVVGGRFVPGGTMAVGVSAGLLRYPVRQFVLWSVVGAALWTGYGVAVGVLGHSVFPHNAWAGAALAVGIALGTGVVVHLVSARRGRARRRSGGHDGGTPVADDC